MELKMEKEKDLHLEELLKDFEYGSIIGKRQKPYKDIKDAMERQIIELALRKTFGNQLKAAKILGINRNTLRAKIKKLGIDIERWKL
jgi:two-component system nitrogen regulation response regulator GlnG